MGAIQLNLKSGHRETTENEILVVKSSTVNLLGQDVLGKLGFTLSQNKGTHVNNIQTDTPTKLRIIREIPPPMHPIGQFEKSHCQINNKTKHTTIPA